MLTRKQRQPSKPNSQSGFTIMESLLAIIVVAILLTAVAPLIVFSVGTRVQARRVDRATQGARSYIDAVRSGAIPAPANAAYLAEVEVDPDTAARQYVSKRGDFAQVVGPSGTLPACTPPTTPDPNNPYPYCQNDAALSLYCVDQDDTPGCSNTSTQDLIVQAIRSTTVDPALGVAANDDAKGYVMSVRIYRADGFDGTPLQPTAGQTNLGQKQSTFTGGLGDRKSPLYESTTEITGQGTTFQDFCTRFGGCQDAPSTNPAPSPSPSPT